MKFSPWFCRSGPLSWYHLCVFRILSQTWTQLESRHLFWRCCVSRRFRRSDPFNVRIVIGFLKFIQVYSHMPLERWMVSVDERDGNGWYSLLCMFWISLMGHTQDFYSRGHIDRHTVPHLIFHCTHLVSPGKICIQCYLTLLSMTLTLDF